MILSTLPALALALLAMAAGPPAAGGDRGMPVIESPRPAPKFREVRAAPSPSSVASARTGTRSPEG